MSTLRVDNIKGRTGTTVTIPDSQNLAVTGGLTVTGTQSFAAGASLSLQGENVNSGTRGDVLYYNTAGKIAKLSVGTVGQVLKTDGSDVSWGAIGNAANVYYVTTNGADSAGRGASIDTAWKTLKYACSNVGNPTASAPAVIFVKGGTYEEVSLPIVVPQFTTIVGDNLRATIIKPGAGLDSGGSVLNTRSTLFRMSNASIIQDLVLDGMGGYQAGSPAHAPENATLGGKYFELNPASAVSDKSPYIYNVTSFGDGATGAVVDGSVHGSGNRSMLFHTYTAIHSDGLGVWCKDNGNAELISVFTYYNQIGISATGGGTIRSLNSSNSYGEYGVYSAGYDATETTNDGTVKGSMLTYTNVLTGEFTLGEQITGATSGATAYVANVQSEPKRIYIVGKSVNGFQASETVTGGSSNTTATLAAASFDTNADGRILVTQFANSAVAGDSLEFATTDGNAYQIQTVSSVTANSVAYHVLVFSTSRPTPVADGVTVKCRKNFSLVRLTGHDFLSVGTGDSTTTNWPNNPTQAPSQADQIITNTTDPGRVYHVSTDELGNFYVGDFFKVDQATGKVTLDSSAFDLKGLESLQLGSVGGLIGAQINEFSTDVTLSQNDNAKVPTQRAVKTYVDALSGVSGNFTIAGDLTVSGTTTSVNTTNTNVTDKLIELGNGTTGSASGDAGLVIERGSDSNVFIGWDESEDKIRFCTTTATGASTGNLTLTDASVMVGDIETARITTNEIIERINLDTGGGLNGSTPINLAEKAVHYFATATVGNWTWNVRGDGSTALNTIMATGDAMTFTAIANNGGTARHMAGFEIDGVSQTVKWVSDSPVTAGNANSLDVYSFSIIKTGNAAFTVIGSMTQYK